MVQSCSTCSTHAYTGNFQAHELQHHDTDALNMHSTCHMTCLLESTLCATCWADVMITVPFRGFTRQCDRGERNRIDKAPYRKTSRQPAASLRDRLRRTGICIYATHLAKYLCIAAERDLHQHTNKSVKRNRDACSHVNFFAERAQRAALQIFSSAGMATCTDRRADFFTSILLVHTTSATYSQEQTLQKEL